MEIALSCLSCLSRSRMSLELGVHAFAVTAELCSTVCCTESHGYGHHRPAQVNQGSERLKRIVPGPALRTATQD
jgi:hypothetical protein